MRKRHPGAVAALIAFASTPALVLSPPAGAASLPCPGGVGNPADLIGAIVAADTAPTATTITLAPGCTYTLTEPLKGTSVEIGGTSVPLQEWYGPDGLPAIAADVTIAGSGSSIRRSSSPATPPFRLFFVGADPASAATPKWVTPGAGHLTLRDLTLSGGLAAGGPSSSGGGGLGAGGAIYDQGRVTLERVTLAQNAAVGGFTESASGGPSHGGGMSPMAPEAGFGNFVPPIGASKGSEQGGGGGLAQSENGVATKGGGGGAFGAGTGGFGGSGGSVLAGIAGGFGGDGAGGGGDGAEAGEEAPPKTAPGGEFGRGGVSASTGTNGYGEGGGGGGVGGGGGAGTFGSGGVVHYGGGGGGGGFGGGGGQGGFANEPGAGGVAGQGGFGGGGGAAAKYGKPALGGFGGGSGTLGSSAGGIGGAGAGFGGAIFVHGGSLTAIDITLAGNVAAGGVSIAKGGGQGSEPGGAGAGLGGAIFDLNGAVSLLNSTLAANSAEHAALYVLGYDLTSSSHPATATLVNSILTGTASVLGAATEDLFVSRPSVVVAEGTHGFSEANANPAAGSAVEPNLVSSRAAPAPATLAGSPLTGNALLGALAFNGGPGMATMVPQANSPALAAGDPGAGPGVDERGVARPGGGPTDLGAVQISVAAGLPPAPGPGKGATPLPPVLAGVSQTHAIWREGSRLARISRRRRPPVGTTFSFTLSQQTRVLFTFTQPAGGRKEKGRCAAPTKRNRHARACRRTLVRGTLAFSGHPGRNNVSFQGRLSARNRLRPGRYSVTIIATNAAGQRSNAQTLSFTIVP